MTAYDHTELRKQYEAEAAFNSQAYLNWQSLNWQSLMSIDIQWVTLCNTPEFMPSSMYRRDPGKPPFVAPTIKQQAMDRAGEVFYEEQPDGTTTSVEPTETLKRHEHADLLIAIAEGKQMQIDVGDSKWRDCMPIDCFVYFQRDLANQVRIKPSTRIVQCRAYYLQEVGVRVRFWVEGYNIASQNVLEKSPGFKCWLGEMFTVEAPV
jgi:hypothetical protein